MEELSLLLAGTHPSVFTLDLIPAQKIVPIIFPFFLCYQFPFHNRTVPIGPPTCYNTTHIKNKTKAPCFLLSYCPPATSHFHAIFHSQTPQNYLCLHSLLSYLLFFYQPIFFWNLFLTLAAPCKLLQFLSMSQNKWSVFYSHVTHPLAAFNSVGHFLFNSTFP